MTNIVSFNIASSRYCKDISKMINKLLNDTATHFKKSFEAKCKFKAI